MVRLLAPSPIALAAQGSAGWPNSERMGLGFDLEQEQVRAQLEVEAGDRPVPPTDHWGSEGLYGH